MIDARANLESVAAALRSAAPTLDPAEQRLGLELYRLLLAGRPVTTRDLASSAGLDEGWGLAIRGMPHRMTTDEGAITTWCALDPLIIAPLVTEEARVESADPVSGEPIRLTVTPDGVRDLAPSEARVSMLAPDGPFGHDVVQSFCHFVHFFASEATAESWVADHPGTFTLTVDDAFEVASRSWPALFRDARASSPAAPAEGGNR